jgi:GntR family transcriptional regulator/MocR family aminotransferase
LFARATHDRFPAVFLQDAVADLMADGTFDAHTRRVRKRYREARDDVATALESAAGGALRVDVPTQGLHLLALLPPGVPSGAAMRIREAAGDEAKLLSEMRTPSRATDGFILGFSGHDAADLKMAARRLGQAARPYHARAS